MQTKSGKDKGPGGARRVAAAAFGLALSVSTPGLAADSFELRLFGVGLSPAGDRIAVAEPSAEPVRFGLSDGSAFGFEVGYRWKPRVVFELMALFGDYDAELALAGPAVGAASSGSLGTETYTLGANYRFADAGRTEFWAGVFGGFSYYDDIVLSHPTTGRRETLRFDDDLGFGVKIGLDHSFGADSRWLASGAVRYQSSILEGEVAGQDMDVDPLILTVGAGYRF